MKATGIVRRIDDLGRFVIPMELRRHLGIDEGDPLEVYLSGEHIVIAKYSESCRLCGQIEGVADVDGVKFCNTCLRKVLEAAEDVQPKG